MTREEHIEEDRKNFYEKLHDIETDKEYTPEEIIEILKSHNLDNGILKLRPQRNMKKVEIIEKLVEMYSITADAVHKALGLYD